MQRTKIYVFTIIRRNIIMIELSSDDFLNFMLEITDNIHTNTNDSVQKLLHSLDIQSSYCHYNIDTNCMADYGASNRKSLLTKTMLILIRQFYIDILRRLKLFYETLYKIIYSSGILPSYLLLIYLQILFKNTFKQNYSSKSY